MAFTGPTGKAIKLLPLLRLTTLVVNRSRARNLIPLPVGPARAIGMGHLLVIFTIVGERSH